MTYIRTYTNDLNSDHLKNRSKIKVCSAINNPGSGIEIKCEQWRTPMTTHDVKCPGGRYKTFVVTASANYLEQRGQM